MPTSKELQGLCSEVGRMLNGMIAKSSSFCQSPPAIKELRAPYHTTRDKDAFSDLDEFFTSPVV